MRIAVLSDIHGNVFALEAVITDAKRRDADLMLNLGDSIYGPIAARATYELLGVYEFVTIRGNEDRLIYEATAKEIAVNPTLRFVLDELDETAIQWLQDLPFDRHIGEDIYVCHGTPTDDTAYLIDTVESGRPRVRANSEIAALLGAQSSEVVMCGHSHIPRMVSLDSGQLVINPGSVGLPAYTDDDPVFHAMETFCPHASYSMVEKGKNGWTVQYIKVPYDYHSAAAEAAKRKRDDWTHFLTTGRR